MNSLYIGYPSVVKCGRELKRDYARKTIGKFPGRPSENVDFVQVVVRRGYTTGSTPSLTRESRSGRPSESHDWHTRQSTPPPILLPKSWLPFLRGFHNKPPVADVSTFVFFLTALMESPSDVSIMNQRFYLDEVILCINRFLGTVAIYWSVVITTRMLIALSTSAIDNNQRIRVFFEICVKDHWIEVSCSISGIFLTQTKC